MLLLQPSIGVAATAADVEALYDRTGDKLVDVQDWKQLSKQEQLDYVTASLNAFSNPQTPSSPHRIEMFLDAITNLYHYE
ncbi:MAG: hypothetical protein R8J85_02820 [Mariprofundales bacterium]